VTFDREFRLLHHFTCQKQNQVLGSRMAADQAITVGRGEGEDRGGAGDLLETVCTEPETRAEFSDFLGRNPLKSLDSEK
jgi:hypothetical protein